jgi:type I restriction enzyme S subunit
VTIHHVSFLDVFTDESGGNIKTPQDEYKKIGRFPVIDQGKSLVAGYVDDETHLCGAGRPAIVFGDHTRCLKFIDFPFCMGADGVKVLRPKIEADLKYLYYFLKQLNLPDAGYSRHFKYLKRAEVVLPPLPEQRRIAAILDQTEALRAKRREALAQLDSLTQSIFIEMFGDSQAIFSNWPIRNLGELLEFLTSGSRGWAKYYTESGALFLRIQNVCRDELKLDDVAFVNVPDSAEAKRTQVREGDVLLSITADLGRTAVIPAGLDKAHINQHLSILRTKAIAPRYLSAFLSSPAGQREVLGRDKHGVKAGLNFDDIRSFRIPLPPNSLQNEFVHRLDAIAKQKKTCLNSLAELDALFTSLQHRAFRGDL